MTLKRIAYSPLILLGLFFVIHFFFWWSHTHSLYFEDETEHLTPAWMMIHHDRRLYSDISTNHQPIPILVSGIFLQMYPFSDLYQLITGVRLLMYGLSFLGALVLVWRFGYSGLVTAVLLELIKYFFFGYYLLQESLAVYPLLWVMGLVLESFFSSKGRPTDGLLLGVGVFLAGFSLLPLAPLLLGLTGLYFYQKKVTILPGILTIFGLTCVLFLFISPIGWFRETILNNYTYFLPDYLPISGTVDWLTVWLYPLTAWFHPATSSGIFLIACQLMMAVSLFLLWKKMTWPTKVGLLLVWGILPLADIRTLNHSGMYYAGFHALPLLAGYGCLAGFLWSRAYQISLPVIKKWLVLILVLSMLGVFSHSLFFLPKGDKVLDYQTAYSSFQRTAEVINLFRREGDRLFAGPLHGYMNILTDTGLYTRFNAHLNWVYRNPQTDIDFRKLIENDSPEFIYFPKSPDNAFYQTSYETGLFDRYQQVWDTNGGFTHLYISNFVVEQRLESAKYTLKELGYELQ